QIAVTFPGYEALDLADPQAVPMSPKALDDPKYEEEARAFGSLARDCGDFFDHCQSGYTFFRRFTTPRSTADQFDPDREWVYIVYDAIKPGTAVGTGTSYGIVGPGDGGPLRGSARSLAPPDAPLGADYEPQLRAVRQPAGAVRGRLPLGHIHGRFRVRCLDRLAQHRGGGRSAGGGGRR